MFAAALSWHRHALTPWPPLPISGEGEKCHSDASNPEKRASAPLSQDGERGWGRGPVCPSCHK